LKRTFAASGSIGPAALSGAPEDFFVAQVRGNFRRTI
jgi:hypothetical protein